MTSSAAICESWFCWNTRKTNITTLWKEKIVIYYQFFAIVTVWLVDKNHPAQYEKQKSRYDERKRILITLPSILNLYTTSCEFSLRLGQPALHFHSHNGRCRYDGYTFLFIVELFVLMSICFFHFYDLIPGVTIFYRIFLVPSTPSMNLYFMNFSHGSVVGYIKMFIDVCPMLVLSFEERKSTSFYRHLHLSSSVCVCPT